MTEKRNLSSPFASGGGGEHFEAHVQALFVVLMLTGGYVPCLPCWPIAELRLQGRIDGFDTDDVIVIVEESQTRERRKLLGQVKYPINITKGSAEFGEVLQAAWNDFNDPEVFSRGKDIIALMTGPLSGLDQRNVQWLLSQARHTKTVDEFLRNVKQANFSPSESSKKLEVFRHHLRLANGGQEVSEDDLYSFLNHFYILSYDLGNEDGVVLSLMYSHMSQFQQQYPQQLWSRVVDIVQTWNQDAGTITLENLPEDIIDAFEQRRLDELPGKFTITQRVERTDLVQHPDATYLALANLVGGWKENNDADIAVTRELLEMEYETWLHKAREILHCPDSPLSLKNGHWRISSRQELSSSLGSRILDQDLDRFKSLAVAVLKEPDPAFELPPEQRYMASIHGKVLQHSQTLRKGIAEGLAILGIAPQAYSNCSPDKAVTTAILAIREVFTDADWVLWGSLSGLLPTLAEAAPDEFLEAVEKTLRSKPCPFDQLFGQERKGIAGDNYLAGLLWALEGLAWNEEYLVRVCVVLGELASHDPGGQSSNRPFNSLATTLLPWLPQTLASIEKRKAAVQTLSKEWPDVGWKLLLELLPNQRQTSLGSYKPDWRKTIPDDWEKGVSSQEYWQQVSFYAELAVSAAGYDAVRLSELINQFDSLPKLAFDQLIDVLSSSATIDLPEEQRLLIWGHLTRLTRKHRRYEDTKWVLSDVALARIESVAERLAPSSPFNLHQYLFSGNDFELYDEKGNWEEQQNSLNKRRETAVREIFEEDGIHGVIRFAESVVSPSHVGQALVAVSKPLIESTLLPSFLDSEDGKHLAFVSGYIWSRHRNNGWEWFDETDKSAWTTKQIGQCLALLPFSWEAWERAQQLLANHLGEYWSRTGANAYEADKGLNIAIDKLIEYGRPQAALKCLSRLRHTKQPISVQQCVRALLAALSSSEPISAIDKDEIVELIRFIQSEPRVAQEDLFEIEWAYLSLLNRYRGAAPKLLENRLASDPVFFCDVIRLVYRSKKEDKPQKEPSKESKAIAANAWRLLHEWKIPPGTQEDGVFNADHFDKWLEQVRTISSGSGHLEISLICIGTVLVHAPAEPGGLWIHRTIAEALNDRDAEDMRTGYRSGIYNARGVHWVDPSGQAEKELAEDFRQKADEVENAGYQRLAKTLRDLAGTYEREAERITAGE